MRLRRKYWFVPALAILGIILALMHFYAKPAVHEEVLQFDPNEPAPPLPTPAPKSDELPVSPQPDLPAPSNPAPAPVTPLPQ